MAVRNNIANANRDPLPDKPVEFKSGDEIVKLSPSIIRNFLVNGNGNVTDQEVAMFLNLCRFQHLNPFLREAYLVKYGNQDATVVIGKEAFMKRAMRNQKYAGQQAGIVIYHPENKTLENRIGALLMEGEQLVGGWGKVYVKGYDVPIEIAVSFEEYVGRTKEGEINGQWKKKPATMIRKVALVQALREAFPEDLGNLYTAEEVGVEIDETNMTPIEMNQPEQSAEKPPAVESNGYYPDEMPDYSTADQYVEELGEF